MVRQGEPFHFSSLARSAAGSRPGCGEPCGSTAPSPTPPFPSSPMARSSARWRLASLTVERQWTEDEISGLKLVAQIFGHVISRRRAEERAEQLRDEIQRSSRASMLGELAAALAHEINQPLTTILGNAQAARRFIDQGTARSRGNPGDPRRHHPRRQTRRRGRSETCGKCWQGVPARREPSCINEIVSEVAEFLRSEMKGEGVGIATRSRPLAAPDQGGAGGDPADPHQPHRQCRRTP